MSYLSKAINFLFDFLSKRIHMNIRHFFSFLISKLYSNKINEKLVAFGSTNGHAFSGNSKDIYLYLMKNSDYRCVWFSSSKRILNNLEKKGYYAISNRNIFQSIKVLKAAKYIFITHGFGDVLLVDFSPGTVIVHLDHGSAIKRIGTALDESFLNIFQKIVHNFWNKKISYLTVCSEETKRTKMFSYDLPPERVIITGYPRNDVLINNTTEITEKIKNRLNIEKNQGVLLYAPTFRDYKNESPLKEDLLERIDNLLDEKRKILLYKPHPFEKKVDLSKYKRIKSIDPNIDIRDLLVISDLLITDYSGVIFDYLITLRPILFFSYDLEKYRDLRDFFYDYESFVPGPIIKTGNELLLKLENIEEWSQQYYDKRVTTRELFHKYHDGNAIERIIDTVGLTLRKKEVKSRQFKIPIKSSVGVFTSFFNVILEKLSKFLGMNVKHLFSYFLSKLCNNEVNEKLLVFGSTNGQAFAGNSRVLFEYLCEHSNYYCVWITASEKVYLDLKNHNYNAVLNKNIIQAVKLLKTAKFIFISHGFGDIFFIDFSPKSKLIHLAHGISFKKGGFDLEKPIMPFVEKLMNKLFVKAFYIFIDSSYETVQHKMTLYGISSKRFRITGYPRNDILLDHSKDLEENIKRQLNIQNYDKIILYAPTFRDYEYINPLTHDFLIKLDSFLEKIDIVFLYKPHPHMENVDFTNYKNIKSIGKDVDIQDLLIISDLLITDFSSVFYDYLLTLKPMIFFANDLEKYASIRGFYYDYKSFVPGPFVETGEELIEKLKAIEKWEPEFKEKRKLMRDQFNKYSDGKATQRIIELLELKTV